MRAWYNKKGGEKLLSVWWFAVLAIVGASVVIAVLMYSSGNIDVRGIESSVISNKVYNCINDNGILISSFFDSKFDIINQCGFSSEAFRTGSNFMLKVALKDSNGNEIKSLVEGDAAFEKDCDIVKSGTVSARNYPKCTYANGTINYFENNRIKTAYLNILTASNQIGGKVPLVSSAI